MRALESITAAKSNGDSARTCGNSKPELRTILGIVRSIVPKGTGKWLERTTGAAQRTTEYWLAGKYQPRGEDAMAIVCALRAEIEQRSRALQQFELDLR